MKSLALSLLSIALLAPPSQAAPDGVPARVKSLGDWMAHDPAKAAGAIEAWTAADALAFLEHYPDTVLDLGFSSAKPPGIVSWKEMGARIDELQSLAKQRQIPVDERLCIDERPDVMMRQAENLYACHPSRSGGGCDWEGDMDGSLGESESVVKVAGQVSGGADKVLVDATAKWFPGRWVHRLAVLRPRSADEEVIRIVDNDETSFSVGKAWRNPPQADDEYEIRGSFDPAWVKRVSRETQQQTLARFWTNLRNVCGEDGQQQCAQPAEPLDPFDPANRRGWVPWVDRASIEALRTPSTVPALYGFVRDQDDDSRSWEDPFYYANGVIMDVKNPAYRAWRIRYLLYKLADYGFQPGEGACVQVGYKPGRHTFHDESQLGAGTTSCSEAGTNTWIGPAHICRDRTEINGGFAPTTFRAGEFETGINAYLREMISTLAANGYGRLRVVTAEAPRYRAEIWSVLDEDVRRNPKMAGNWAGPVMDPPLSELADSGEPAPDPGDSGPGATDPTGETDAPDATDPSDTIETTDTTEGGDDASESPTPDPDTTANAGHGASPDDTEPSGAGTVTSGSSVTSGGATSSGATGSTTPGGAAAVTGTASAGSGGSTSTTSSGAGEAATPPPTGSAGSGGSAIGSGIGTSAGTSSPSTSETASDTDFGSPPASDDPTGTETDSEAAPTGRSTRSTRGESRAGYVTGGSGGGDGMVHAPSQDE